MRQLTISFSSVTVFSSLAFSLIYPFMPSPMKRTLANSVDRDQSPQNAASDQGQHYQIRHHSTKRKIWVYTVLINFKNSYKTRKCVCKTQCPYYMLSLIHHNLFITLLLGSIAITVLVSRFYIQTKMYRLY